MRIALFAASATLLLMSCADGGKLPRCGDGYSVASPAIGKAFVRDLTSRLAGPDRENTIAEAIRQMRSKDPTIATDDVVDVVIAADCPNVTARADADRSSDLAHVAALREQVYALLGEAAAP
jgi:hypothetical protein